MIKLRPYQAQAVEEVDEALRKYQKVIYCAATGSGKGFLIGYWVERYTKEGKRILILSSRTEIMKQNVDYASNFGVKASIVNPKVKDCPTDQVVVAMCQTIRRRIDKPEWLDWLKTFSFVCIDECHEQVSDFIHDYLDKDVWLLGLTGTPRRYGSARQLGSIYNCMVETIDIGELVNQGYLSRCKLYSIVGPSLDDVPIDYSNGEFNQKQLAKKYENKTLYQGCVQEWLRICPNKKTICFCVSAEQAIAITKEFNDNGVSAKYLLSGKFDDDTVYSGERNEITDAFDRGEFTVLVNVGCLVAGYDSKSIEVVIANYATTSLPKWLQSIGRASRVTENKHEFILLDCGMNYKRLGRYEDKRVFSLWHDRGSGQGVLQLKLCDPTTKDRNGKYGCNSQVPSTCSVCPCCGKILVDKQWEQILHLEEVLENSENDIEKWCIQRKLDGWSVPRILIALCTAQTKENMKKAFKIGYMAISGKTEAEAKKYYFIFMRNFGDKILRRKQPKTDPAEKLF